MRHRDVTLALLVTMIALAGCSTYSAARYVASADTGQALRAYQGKATVAVSPFAAAVPNQREMKCREKGHFTTPDGETFEEYVRQAFVSELTRADLYTPGAPVTLTGRLLTLDFSQGVADASWTFQFELRSSEWAVGHHARAVPDRGRRRSGRLSSDGACVDARRSAACGEDRAPPGLPAVAQRDTVTGVRSTSEGSQRDDL